MELSQVSHILRNVTFQLWVAVQGHLLNRLQIVPDTARKGACL